MKKILVAILSGTMLLSLGSCGDTSLDSEVENAMAEVAYPKAVAFDDTDAEWEIREQNPVKDDFITAVNAFSYETAESLLKERNDNFNYSPLSLYYALALAGTGAEGDTQKQILKLLGVSSQKTLSTQCGNLYRIIYTDNQISKLKIANSLWLDKELSFKEPFVSNAASQFYASAHSVDFSDTETAAVMAEWISENTNGTLKPQLEIHPEQIFSLINTVYFKDEWINRFDKDKTEKAKFHTGNKDVESDFMNQEFGSSEFIKGDHFTRSSLGLKGSGSMIFILPDEDVTVSDLISQTGSLKTLFEEGERHMGEVVWKIPKFNFGTKMKLADAIQTLGVTDAFQPQANFSGITDGTAFISEITQQTHIAIDENGVEASAFTQIDYFGAALPDGRAEMILDRPFLYGITSSKGVLLFIGVCNDPSQQL